MKRGSGITSIRHEGLRLACGRPVPQVFSPGVVSQCPHCSRCERLVEADERSQIRTLAAAAMETTDQVHTAGIL